MASPNEADGAWATSKARLAPRNHRDRFERILMNWPSLGISKSLEILTPTIHTTPTPNYMLNYRLTCVKLKRFNRCTYFMIFYSLAFISKTG